MIMDKIQEHLSEFELYYSLLAEWNQKFNLTTVTDRDGVFTRHFADSIAAAEYIPQGAKVCDIGSGAGFPGLPLKIVRPDLSVTLFDSVNKKITFLTEVIARLAACQGDSTPSPVTLAIHSRAEDAGASAAYREQFDVALSRAVAPLPVLCEYALPLIKTGGLFIAYKTAAAANDEIKAAQNALKILNGKVKQVVTYPVKVYGAETTAVMSLIIIEKTGPAPLKYPRGGNKPRLNPL